MNKNQQTYFAVKKYLISTVANFTIFANEYHNKWYNSMLKLAVKVDIKKSDLKKHGLTQDRTDVSILKHEILFI